MGNQKTLYFTNCLLKKEPVTICVAAYQNNANLYVGMNIAEGEEKGMKYGDISSNIAPLPPYAAAIKTFSENAYVNRLLEEGKLGSYTPRFLVSGFVKFPVFQFDKKRMLELDPAGCAMYESARARNEVKMQKLPLFEIICENTGSVVMEIRAKSEQDALAAYEAAYRDPAVTSEIKHSPCGLRIKSSIGGCYRAIVKECQ